MTAPGRANREYQRDADGNLAGRDRNCRRHGRRARAHSDQAGICLECWCERRPDVPGLWYRRGYQLNDGSGVFFHGPERLCEPCRDRSCRRWVVRRADQLPVDDRLTVPYADLPTGETPDAFDPAKYPARPAHRPKASAPSAREPMVLLVERDAPALGLQRGDRFVYEWDGKPTLVRALPARQLGAIATAWRAGFLANLSYDHDSDDLVHEAGRLGHTVGGVPRKATGRRGHLELVR